MSASYFKSTSYIDGTEIRNTSIDMNSKRITSVGDPINTYDAVNKNYVDSVGTVDNISLIDTDYTIISTKLIGSVHIIVSSIIPDGPCATFFASKSKSSKHAHILRHTSAPGDGSKEQLDIRWEPSEGIKLNKTGLNYNGSYSIKIF